MSHVGCKALLSLNLELLADVYLYQYQHCMPSLPSLSYTLSKAKLSQELFLSEGICFSNQAPVPLRSATKHENLLFPSPPRLCHNEGDTMFVILNPSLVILNEVKNLPVRSG